MPLFSKKKKEPQASSQPNPVAEQPAVPQSQPQENSRPAQQNDANQSRANGSAGGDGAEKPDYRHKRPEISFHCQKAEGSPTGIIKGFTNVRELYEKIAECYEVPVSDILFCTLNTHKIDMSRLLGGQIGLDDFIFAHMRGRPKELDIEKSEDALGLTITDNGNGFAFIKRIKEGSIMDRQEYVCVGDHIEKINDNSFVGCRHFEVAKALKEIPKGSTFTFRIVEPVKSGFANIGPSAGGGGKKTGSYGSGKETLRLRSKGPATVEVDDDIVNVAVDRINGRLETYLGINDSELARTIWDIGSEKKNTKDFMDALDETELQQFEFSPEFMFELWGDISDAKSGRTKKVQEFEEQF